jgi:hypothetical protein
MSIMFVPFFIYYNKTFHEANFRRHRALRGPTFSFLKMYAVKIIVLNYIIRCMNHHTIYNKKFGASFSPPFCYHFVIIYFMV